MLAKQMLTAGFLGAEPQVDGIVQALAANLPQVCMCVRRTHKSTTKLDVNSILHGSMSLVYNWVNVTNEKNTINGMPFTTTILLYSP